MPQIRPRILLVSDHPPDPDGLGSSRTLYNLLVNWAPERILVCCWKTGRGLLDDAGGSQAIMPSITIRRDPIRIPGRFKAVRPLLRAFYEIWYQRQILAIEGRLRTFQPDLMLVYAESIDLYWLAIAAADCCSCPHIQYVMDDMLEPLSARPKIHDFHRNASGWLFVSNRLREVFSERWNIVIHHFIEVHNPVDIKGPELAAELHTSRVFRIVYAGSIWPMHADALYLVAESVGLLQRTGVAVELVVYTKEEMWTLHSGALDHPGCIYGGLKRESELVTCLRSGDLLLVCGSYLASEQSIVSSSIQTKLSDYMAAGKPILSVGPSYSICHEFIREWDCGYFCSSQDADDCAQMIESLQARPVELLVKGRNGLKALKENFSADVIDRRLSQFFTGTIERARKLGVDGMPEMSDTPRVRATIACPGVGHINRGFETFAVELTEALGKDGRIEVSLLTGAVSNNPKGMALRCLKRTGLPARWIAASIGRDSYFIEQLTFAISMMPHLLRNRPEVIFTSDGALCNILSRMRRLFGLRFCIVFSNGGPYSPPYPANDHVHQVLASEVMRAEGAGLAPEHQSLIPYGFRIGRDWTPSQPDQKRKEREFLGLPQDRRIIVSVGAINCSHKRMDYLIRETAGIPIAERPFVVILGQQDEESAAVLELANELLGETGFLVRCVPSNEVCRYLRASDLFVLCSLVEGFGRVIVEAMAEGLACVLHEAEFAREVGGEEAVLIDQTREGELEKAIRRLLQNPDDRESKRRRRDNVCARLSWDSLLPRYVEMVQLAGRKS